MENKRGSFSFQLCKKAGEAGFEPSNIDTVLRLSWVFLSWEKEDAKFLVLNDDFQARAREKFSKTGTVIPFYSAPAFKEIPLIEHTDFGPMKLFYLHLYVGNNENLSIEYNFDQSPEMRYSGV